ncbi:ATP-grasp fold amidoligase family protein [Natronococcus sp. A-GB7]|uniref:ATP-grasp fold amidoligase family protein n=1 Tax=Natronococcus sp. A-GB7 TaxID=3037649 RepID=UPI00241C2DEA|nr:ATP-grasp fold amidoligase family protein [Natronococcus sp. A-GB7]MDG5821324.1 ATP-grasp fold amidoligase family protein [Natronococcus sp. A-GB7]
MEITHKAQKAYRKGGVRHLFNEIWERTVFRSKISYILKQAIGKEQHERLGMAPLVGYWPDFENPRSFNEKIAYRKLKTNKSCFSTLSDKYLVREYVKERVGEEYLTDLYHVTDNPETIPFEELPDKFVIKANHSSGRNRIVTNKSDIDTTEIKYECRQWLSEDFDGLREYWYTEIKPRITIEEFLDDDLYEVPLDYKFFVFDGEVEYVQVDYGRFGAHTRSIYDNNWEEQPFEYIYPKAPPIDKPDSLEEMIEVAESLADNLNFVRVDLFDVEGGGIYFGEMTFAPEGGTGRFQTKEYDFAVGSHWSI